MLHAAMNFGYLSFEIKGFWNILMSDKGLIVHNCAWHFINDVPTVISVFVNKRLYAFGFY